MPVSISEFITWREANWEQVSAAGTALILLVLIFSFFVQKYLVRGLSFGAVKE
jgi:multiple sugar transport system permease protein